MYIQIKEVKNEFFAVSKLLSNQYNVKLQNILVYPKFDHTFLSKELSWSSIIRWYVESYSNQSFNLIFDMTLSWF